LTYIAEGSVNYEDTNGARGLSAITPIRSCSLGLRKS
jgi:hypothetical protein